MYSPIQTKDANSSAGTSSNLATSLPLELILAIVDAAIAQHRVDNIYWCLQLSLVSHTIRAHVLPLAYDFLFLKTTERLAGSFTGWNGQTHKHLQSAFLSWLLHDPNAPPRRHIKHLVFTSDSFYDEEDLNWGGPRTDVEPSKPLWPIEQLTCRYYGDMMGLYCVGIQPRKMLLVGITPHDDKDISPRDVFTRLLLTTPVGSHNQVWTEEPEKSQGGGFTTRLKQQTATRREIHFTKAHRVATATPKRDSATMVLTIQLSEGDYLHNFPNVFLMGLEDVLQCTKAEIVLACNVDYRVTGQTVAKFIHGSTQRSVSAEVVKARVRISHKAWLPRDTTEDLFTTLVKAELRGHDPWDTGRSF